MQVEERGGGMAVVKLWLEGGSRGSSCQVVWLMVEVVFRRIFASVYFAEFG